MIYSSQYDKQVNLAMHAEVGLRRRGGFGKVIMINDGRTFMDDGRSTVCNGEMMLQSLDSQREMRSTQETYVEKIPESGLLLMLW